jgi:hypothetical protein
VGFLPSLRERRGKKTATVSELERTMPESLLRFRTRAPFHPPWLKGKPSIPQMHIVCNLLQFMHGMSLNIVIRQSPAEERAQEGPLSLGDVEMPLTIASLSTVEQDREAKGPRLLLGEKGHMGYV